MIYRSPSRPLDLPVAPLADHVFEQAYQWPEAPALVDGVTGRVTSYGALTAAVSRTAAGLAERGLAKGDVAAIYSPNVPDYATVFFGVAKAGGVSTTINPAFTPDEVARQLQAAGATWLAAPPALLHRVADVLPDTSVSQVVVLPGTDTEPAAPGRARLPDSTPLAELNTDRDAPAVSIAARDDLVALPFSSGTMGLPKGVMLTHFNLVANLEQIHAVEPLTPLDVVIGILPFYHIFGMVVIMCNALRRGATVVTMPRFELEAFLALLQRHRVTMAHVVPPIVAALARHPSVDDYDLSPLEQVLSGAAPLPEPVARACADRLGVTVRQGYGLTETSPVTHSNPRHGTIKPTSVGPAVPNTEFRIVDPATGVDRPAGSSGEILVRGPQVMKGYLNDPDATHALIDGDGWLHTGDIGHVDADSYLYVVDRVKDLIKYKGLQVAPAELEAVIQAHPAVADVAVIPSRDDTAGEVPKALVVRAPRATVSADEIMSHVAARVAPYKKVRKVEFVDAIPKVPSGKILRRQLVERERARENTVRASTAGDRVPRSARTD